MRGPYAINFSNECAPRCHSIARMIPRRARLRMRWHTHNQLKFDDSLSDVGFEVHSFVPTIKYRSAHNRHEHKHVHFHYIGLQSAAVSAACHSCDSQSGGIYGKLGGKLLGDAGGRVPKLLPERTI